MKYIKNVILIIILIMFIYLTYVTLSYFAKIFDGASDTVKAASITALTSIVIVLIGRFLEQKREMKQKVNLEKIDLYKKFFELYFNLFNDKKITGKDTDRLKIMEEMLNFQKNIVFWGSDSVIRSYLEFKDEITAFSQETVGHEERLAKIFKSVAKLLVAMRRDVGYTFTSFSAHDLARLQLAGGDDENKLISKLK